MYIRPNQAYQIRETNGDMTKELVHHSGYHYKLVWAGPLLLLRQRQDSRMDEISRVFYLEKYNVYFIGYLHCFLVFHKMQINFFVLISLIFEFYTTFYKLIHNCPVKVDK